ncbi:MAG: serine/threonine protein kinase, partial [Myxococcota bacterium]
MGERFGKFEIITRIATGGMAEIFLAKQVGIEGFQKLIVIKRILPHLSSDKEFVNMFLDEARMAAQLNHPNIVQIYDLGVIEGSYFIAMEYIDGVDISSILKKGREKKNFLRLGWILKIISQVCEGLYYAHTLKDSNGIPLGLIHRDITPENLLVSFTGSVKITDFGIARARGRSTSTTSGTLKGKFPYMFYEMVKGMEIDARSDIFSLGIVMWEMLTYRRLFKRDTEVASINAILNEEIPSPKKYFKNLPDGVEKIVMKALERDRDKRFQTAREMGNAIEDFISQKRVIVRISDLSDYLTELFPDRGISGDKKLTSSKIDKIVEIKEHKSASNSLPVITIQKKNPVGENGTVVLPPPTLEIKPEPEGGIDGNQEIEKKGEEISSDSNVKPLPKVIEEMEIGGHYVQEDKISNRHNEGTKSESLEVAREVIATTPSNKQSGKRNLLIAAVLMSLVLLVGVIFFVLNLGKRDEAVLNTTPKLLKEEGEKKASGIGEKEVVEERKEMGDAERSEVEKEKMEQSIEEKNRKAETVRKKEQKVASVERPKIQENVKKVEKM